MSNEDIIDELITKVNDGMAVVVRGDYGSGKVEHCKRAIEKMGLVNAYINLGCIEPAEFCGLPNIDGGKLSSVFDKLPNNAGVIIDDLHTARLDFMPQFMMTMLEYIRFPKHGKKSTVFITVPYDSERYDVSARLKDWALMIGGVVNIERKK